MTGNEKSILLNKLANQTISEEEYRTLELSAVNDEFLFGALEGYDAFKGKTTGHVEELKAKIEGKTQSKKRILWWPIAAAASAILIIGFIGKSLFTDNTTETPDALVIEEATGEVIEGEIVATLDTSEKESTEDDQPNGQAYAMQEGRQEKANSTVESFKPNVKPKAALSQSTQQDNTKQAPRIEGLRKNEANKEVIEADQTVVQPGNRSDRMRTFSMESVPARNVTGKVTDKNGNPIPGAEVKIGQAKVTTDTRGSFSLDLDGAADQILLVQSTNFGQVNLPIQTGKNHYDVVLSPSNALTTDGDTPRALRTPSLNRNSGAAALNWSKFNTFVKNNLKKPQSAVDQSVSGTVILTFDINDQKQIQNIKVKKGLGQDCDDEAIRVLNLGAKELPFPASGVQSTEYTFNF